MNNRTITPPSLVEIRDKSQEINKCLSIDDKVAFIFDFDLTIADTREAAKTVFNHAIERCGGEYSEEELFEYLTTPLETTYSKIMAANCSFEEFCDVYYEKNHDVFCGSTTLYPDASRLLYRLKHTGKKLAIVTNRDLESIKSFLDNIGQTTLFDVLICRENVEKQKPDPEPINRCLKELGVSSSEAIYFGDALNDGKAAFSADVDFIYVDKYDRNVKFDFSVLQVVNNFDFFYTSDDSKAISNCLNVISRIADEIKDKKYVVFVGPEILESPYNDKVSNNSRRKILENLCNGLDADIDIGLKQREVLNSSTDETYLDIIRHAPFKPNRDHELMAKLNFVAYVYFYYDSVLADTIGGDKISVISSGMDIKKWDMFGDKKPFIYPLKQLNDGGIIFSDELGKIDSDVSNLISNICYNKNILLIGLSVFESEKIIERFGSSFLHDVVIVNDSDYLKYEKNNRITKIYANESLLLKLLYVKSETGNLSYTDLFVSDEELVDWSIDLAYVPTPTEVIDLFLKMLKKEIIKAKREKNKIRYISSVVDNGINKIMDVKGNFAPVRVFCDALKSFIKDNDQNQDDFLTNLSIFIERIEINRKKISTNIEMAGKLMAQKSKSKEMHIALYGMSNRVLDFLRGYSLNERMNVTAYIAECSQKNKDLNYSDDYKYFEAIKQKEFNNVVFFQIPDIMLYDLIVEKNINMILFGVHAIFVDDKRCPQIIRNINGIGLFTKLAFENDIQVLMIGEKDKIRSINELTDFSIEETKEPIYKNFVSSGINVLRNVRRNEELKYDPRIIIITEDGEYKY